MNDGFGVVSANHSHTVLVGGWTTHLKNMIVKLDTDPPNRDKHKKKNQTTIQFSLESRIKPCEFTNPPKQDILGLIAS